jgi:hypothetical protein
VLRLLTLDERLNFQRKHRNSIWSAEIVFSTAPYVDAVGFGLVHNLQVPRSSRKLSALLGMVCEGVHHGGEVGSELPNSRTRMVSYCFGLLMRTVIRVGFEVKDWE